MIYCLLDSKKKKIIVIILMHWPQTVGQISLARFITSAKSDVEKMKEGAKFKR